MVRRRRLKLEEASGTEDFERRLAEAVRREVGLRRWSSSLADAGSMDDLIARALTWWSMLFEEVGDRQPALLSCWARTIRDDGAADEGVMGLVLSRDDLKPGARAEAALKDFLHQRASIGQLQLTTLLWAELVQHLSKEIEQSRL